MRALKDGLTRILELGVISMFAALVCVVLWGVVSRFVLSEPSRWTEELATFLLTWVALLGAAVGLSRKQHLGVDYLVNQLHPEARMFLQVMVQCLVVAFACSAMVYGGTMLVTETLHAGQLTPALGIRMGFVYLAMPISGLFMVLFGLEEILALLSPLSGRLVDVDMPENLAASSQSVDQESR